ncbi:RimJ/RimL family protein N-acetyltransferase [Conyzicola nivalis]|uniref:RimJ/RimL family protein N-acetyltransferase n=1 Tax=Conyzicola nivalis TaxID=1477021 RepID=A0ABV2QTV3_9MICO
MSLPWTPVYPIVTERLVLRPHTPADLGDLRQFHSDPDVVRYIPWPVRSEEETRVALQARVAQGRVDADGQWLVLAIELAETGQVIGEVLLKCASAEKGEGELGYALNAAFHRRGYAFEAAHRMLSLGFAEFGLGRITATLDARNAASAGLLEKLGMTLDSVARDQPFKGELVDELTYAIDAKDFS